MASSRKSKTILSTIDQTIQKYVLEHPPSNFGLIYAIIHKKSFKAYIGQSFYRIKKRVKKHIRETGCAAIHAALKKYGLSAFHVLVLKLCPKTELDKYEEESIEFFDTISPNGYNIRYGGNQMRLHKDTIQKIHSKRNQTIKKIEFKTRLSQGVSKAWADEEHRVERQTNSDKKMHQRIANAWKTAVPLPPNYLRKNGAYYTRDDKVYRYSASGRGNLFEISEANIQAKREETKLRIRKKRKTGIKNDV
jgi:group I intron endonuclease